MNVKKIRAGIKAILSVLDTNSDWILIPTFSRSDLIKRLRTISYTSFDEKFSKFYPSSVYGGMNTLRRKGLVELRETSQGTEVRITDQGRTQVLKYQLGNLQIEKPPKWDRKWRLVFFDVEEMNRTKRNRFREVLLGLGLKPLQRSVFIYPYSCYREIKYIREVIGVPHGVKLVTAEEIENDEELRVIFNLD